MTIIAGVYATDGDVRSDLPIWLSIKKSLSRNKSDKVIEFVSQKCCMAKIDIGAFATQGVYKENGGSFAMLAGDPLLEPVGRSHCRHEDLKKMFLSLIQGRSDIFSKTRGMYCAAFYNTNKQSLWLVADKFGLRPLYYLIEGNLVLFASAQRIFEKINEIPLKMSLRGTTEKIIFGTPLSNRTPYVDLLCLNDAEIIKYCGYKKEINRYWEWVNRKLIKGGKGDHSRKLHEIYIDSTALRLDNDKTARAYLSGGLDSRCVVGGLLECGARVVTYNFSRKNTYDQLISSEFAKALGIQHHSEILKEDEGTKQHAHNLNVHFPIAELPNEAFSRPQIVWTGDGGSVGAGYVYLSGTVVGLLRSNKIRPAVIEFLALNKMGIGKRILKCPPFGDIENTIVSWVQAELDKFTCVDPGRKLFVFLMKNDQRRHFFGHLEEIDISRIEYLSPFFDPEFLLYFSSLPIDECLYHKMYMEWLNCFSRNLTSVPWQAYDGHIPCPLPMPVRGRSQWDKDKKYRHGWSEYYLRHFAKTKWKNNFPDPIISKLRLNIAKMLVKCNRYSQLYLLQQALVYHKYWEISQGIYVNDLNS